MLGDKVSNLLVNLGEEELKDYKSLKQIVIKMYEPSPKICLENFRKAKRNSVETFSQFASHLTSMWLYYCKLRGANDFESVNQLIVADKMFEMLDSETATHIGRLQGEEWYKPRDLGKQCDIFYASKGKSYDEPERAKWNIVKGEVLMAVGVNSHLGKKNKHFKRDCPKNKGVDNKRLNVNKVSTELTELKDGTVAARVDLLGKVIPRRAIEDKLSKLVKTSISVDGKLVHALVDSGTEITVIKKDLVPGISVEGAYTIYLKGIFGPAVKCPLVYVPIGLATGGQVNVVHQQVLCVLVEDVLLPPDVLDMLGGAQSEENSLVQSSQDLRVDSGNVDETKVSLGILPEDKILGESIGQLVTPKCRRTEVLKLAHTSVFSSYMGPKKTLERIKYSFFWEGLRSNVKKFCESCKECQLTRSVTMHQDLAAFYENPEVPNSFVGVEALHHSVKGKYSKKDVKHWLSQKDAYTLHKPVRHKFQRNRVFVSDIDRHFQADLVDMQSLAEFNKGDSSENFCEIIDIPLFSSVLKQHVLCVKCKKQGIDIKFGRQIQGLATELLICCEFCGLIQPLLNTRFTNTVVNKKDTKVYEVNTRLAYAMRSVGKGEAAAKVFCGVMNLPPPPKRFYESLHALNNATEKVAKVSMALAAAETLSFNNGNPNVPVAIDGTWQKKGPYFSQWCCYGS
ncbi:retrovirus-related Pol polyprotein from transposon opus [Trichonephila clavipes]|nr:retrovirus-related Pol polyprotein from transposon opus [Trichonephila clavipes]